MLETQQKQPLQSLTSNQFKSNLKHVQKQIKKFSYKDIQLTFHSLERAEQRLNLTKKTEIKKIAGRAKVNGIKWESLREETYESVFHLTHDEFVYLKAHFAPHAGNANVYFYKGNIFIFVGKNNNKLKTIISLKEILNKSKEEGAD